MDSMALILQQDHRDTDCAQNDAGDDGTKEDDTFATLLPRRLLAIKRFAQQVDRRMFWLDISSMK
jgi:hypothetical protein